MWTPNNYELLGIDPGCSTEEIRQAYKRIRAVFSTDSLAAYGLYKPHEMEQIQEEVDQAYRTLIDPEMRVAYDKILRMKEGEGRVQRSPSQSIPASEEAIATPSERAAFPWQANWDEEGPSLPQADIYSDELLPGDRETHPTVEIFAAVEDNFEITDQTIFDGPTLRQIRQRREISLREIADRTKISVGSLKFMEDENYKMLPARVYLRGFLSAYGAHLGLNPKKVSNDYLEKMAGKYTETL
jgi:curved DNA-binding protein CbpA